MVYYGILNEIMVKFDKTDEISMPLYSGLYSMKRCHNPFRQVLHTPFPPYREFKFKHYFLFGENSLGPIESCMHCSVGAKWTAEAGGGIPWP